MKGAVAIALAVLCAALLSQAVRCASRESAQAPGFVAAAHLHRSSERVEPPPPSSGGPHIDAPPEAGGLSPVEREEATATIRPRRLALLAPSFLPTADGLAARTIDLWASEEFLDISTAEALAWIPHVDGYDATFPGQLQDYLGSLPTRDDVELGMQDGEVHRLLEVLVGWEDVHSSMLFTPKSRRSERFSGGLEIVERAMLSAEHDLMVRLEVVTGYPHWALLARLWREWER